ncbi:MAG: HlyD family efflux transporter periplasmic adaptor subunit [Geobacteraceae bacterium]|nr:HlyD family efflux transporter periplasmic adaptor subunit [Geobacteraceae bacterium]
MKEKNRSQSSAEAQLTASSRPRRFFILLNLILGLSACSAPAPETLHGYIEGEFVYVAAPSAGVVALSVAKGEQVQKGSPLFALESVAERDLLDEAARRVAQARAALLDSEKGLRPTEVAALRARLEQTKSALSLAENELTRQQKLFATGAVSAQSLDRRLSERDQQLQLKESLDAELKTAALGARADQQSAARANVKALEAALARAEWELGQKSRKAPENALVFDTLYRSGEWVPAGRPVVSLLPPGGVKGRFYLSEGRLASVKVGSPVQVTVDGFREVISAKVSFISPRPEYTPPVIYSRENRARLVYLIEVTFSPEKAVNLHPGQPVDIRLGS